jgi:hypothetical protein
MTQVLEVEFVTQQSQVKACAEIPFGSTSNEHSWSSRIH